MKRQKKVKENFKDKFLEMHERQMEALKESDQRNREFLVQLEEQQRKAAIEEKNEIESFSCSWQLFWLKSNVYYNQLRCHFLIKLLLSYLVITIIDICY